MRFLQRAARTAVKCEEILLQSRRGRVSVLEVRSGDRSISIRIMRRFTDVRPRKWKQSERFLVVL